MTKRILIAEIGAAHGVKGLVKLRYFGEDVADLKIYNPLYISPDGNNTLSLTVKNAIKGGYVAEVGNITDRTEAEKLRGQKLYIEEKQLRRPPEGEYFYKDLIGCETFEGDQKIGKVIAVENFGAGDLLEIRPPGGSPFYLPFKDEYVPAVDIAAKRIDVIIPEGLI